MTARLGASGKHDGERRRACRGAEAVARLAPWLRVACAAAMSAACVCAATSARADSCTTTSDTALGPEPAVVLLGDAEVPTHPLSLDLGRCMRLSVSGTGRIRADVIPRLYLDAQGSERAGGAALSPLVRVGAAFGSGRRLGDFSARAVYEHELLNGSSGASDAPAGQGYPLSQGSHSVLRKANLLLAYKAAIGIQLGFDTSYFGLGLLDNDGAHDPMPGSAEFADPRGGDRVLEARLVTGPTGDLGFSAYFALQELVDDELVITDDEAEGVAADEASRRLVLGAQVGGDDLDRFQLRLSLRQDESADGSQADYGVIDVSTSFGFDLGEVFLLLEGEIAYQHGTTQLSPTSLRVAQNLRALGTTHTATLSYERFSFALQGVTATGDGDAEDGSATSFRADPNFELGVLLFRQIIAAQSARSSATAADPTLGVPITNLERLPTGGGISNTIALFPRIGYRVLPGLDAYAGVLFAFAPVEPRDPANTRLAGGEGHTALGAPSGGYWGTEYDVGLRFRALAWGSLLTLGVEGGVVDPGSAMRPGAALASRGVGDDALVGGRAFANYDF